jgi:hypothetical protein
VKNLFVIITVAVVSALVGMGAPLIMPVQASSAPACEPIGATGNIVISRCEDDETGQVIFVNNIGFMILGE